MNYILGLFVLIIEKIFIFSYNITANYGMSIILLSFFISLLLLPVFIFIERAKKKDDAVKRSMKPLVDEIKHCYKGQERFYYLKTLNRQFNYSPIKALIPVLSLVVQIPFFIAAYQFLEGFEPLAGLSFLFIKDLSLPDGVFGVVNVLPVVMTLVNLLTAYFYTRNGDGSERKQMLIVAFAFLILLFNLPSGLVLYWTMNNVFSFFRLFITNPEVFRKRKIVREPVDYTWVNELFTPYLKHKKIFTLLVFVVILLGTLSQINWAFQHDDFRDLHFRILATLIGPIVLVIISLITLSIVHRLKQYLRYIRIRPSLYFSLFLLAAYFFLAAKSHFLGINKDLSIIGLVFLIPTQIISFVYFFKKKSRQSTNYWLATFVVVILISILQLLNLKVLITNKPFVIDLFNIQFEIVESNLAGFISCGLLWSLLTSPFYFKTVKVFSNQSHKSTFGVVFFSILYLSGFVFLWNPLAVYSTFPEVFEFPGISIIKNNFHLFLIAFGSLTILYFVLAKQWKQYLSVTLLSLVIISFFHNTIMPIDVGTLQETKYVLDNNLDIPLLIFFLEGLLILLTVFIVQYLLKHKFSKHIKYALLLLNFILIGQSLNLVFKTGSFWKKDYVSIDIPSSISFSKDKPNVLFIVADMFHGWHMDKVLKEEDEIKGVMEGFIWYPNTLSVSLMTSSSIGSIIGGFDYTVDKLNLDTERTFGEKITEITEDFRDKIKSQGYQFTSTPMIYSSIDVNSFDTYLPKWHEDWNYYNKTLFIGFSREIGYTMLWENALFYSAPLCLKASVYNKGKWLHSNKDANENNSHTKPYNFLRLLPYISDSDNEKPNFVYMHSMASHHPWDIIDDDGTLIADVTPYENNKWTIETLGKWMEWMKEHDVYDNTKIIILSDHGPHWGHYQGGTDKNIPIIPNPELKIWDGISHGLNALMLVKDYNAKGELAVDWRFMSNADAPAIVFDENDPTKGDPPNTRILPSFYARWNVRMNLAKLFDIEVAYDVENNYFDLNNWTLTIDKNNKVKNKEEN